MASKGTGIYRRGKELSYSQVKEQVKQWTGWTDEQYKKQYDVLRNKLRAYEKYSKTSSREMQSPSSVLYRWQRAKHNDPNYQESPAMERILSFPSYSSGQVSNKLKSSKVRARLGGIYSASTTEAFSGLIRNNAKAAEIAKNVSDPVKREAALAAFADKMHMATRTEQNKAIAQSFGSDNFSDFNYDSYLTK